MAIKLKLKTALAIAKQAGYTGEQDAESVKKWLVEKKITIENEDGEKHDFSAVDIESPVTKTAFKIKADDLADDEPKMAPDVEVLIKSKIEDALKAAGVSKAGERPNSPVVTKVVSSHERLYKDRIARKEAKFTDYGRARGFQLWAQAQIHKASGRFADADRCHKAMLGVLETDGWDTKAMASSSLTGGSALFDQAFSPEILKLLPDYGVARRLAKVVPMTQVKESSIRLTSGLTGSYPAENTALTNTQPSYDNITLDANTFTIFVPCSNQILMDSQISVADDLAIEMARGLAYQEDANLLVGDGSTTYGGFSGFEWKYGLTATNVGYAVTGGGDTTAHTAANLDTLIGRLPPQFLNGAVFTCSQTVKANTFDRLATSTAGGLTLTELIGYGLVQAWKGFPIIPNNVMSTVTDAGSTGRPGFTAGDQIDILFGNFAMASRIGTYQEITVESSPHVLFDQNATAFRCVARHAFTVHDVGTTSAAGPVVAFWQT